MVAILSTPQYAPLFRRYRSPAAIEQAKRDLARDLCTDAWHNTQAVRDATRRRLEQLNGPSFAFALGMHIVDFQRGRVPPPLVATTPRCLHGADGSPEYPPTLDRGARPRAISARARPAPPRRPTEATRAAPPLPGPNHAPALTRAHPGSDRETALLASIAALRTRANQLVHTMHTTRADTRVTLERLQRAQRTFDALIAALPLPHLTAGPPPLEADRPVPQVRPLSPRPRNSR